MALPNAATLRDDPVKHARQHHRGSAVKRAWGRVARWITEITGSVWAFMIAISAIVVWGITGPLFHFSDTWQLAINTSTTIITFLMVFLIQQTQNRDSKAMQLKLNELIAAVEGASNKMIDIEDLSEDELNGIARDYRKLVAHVTTDDTSRTTVVNVPDRERPDDDRGG